MFLIRDGSCDVIVTQADGSNIKVATRAKGDFIGEMAVNDEGNAGKARTASVQAVDKVGRGASKLVDPGLKARPVSTFDCEKG